MFLFWWSDIWTFCGQRLFTFNAFRCAEFYTENTWKRSFSDDVWKIANGYDIILPWVKVVWFKKAMKKWWDPRNSIVIKEDEDHWLRWLQTNETQKVSEFLSEKYKHRPKVLSQEEKKEWKSEENFIATKLMLEIWQNLNGYILPKNHEYA